METALCVDLGHFLSQALQDVDHRYLDPFALASMAPPPPLPPLPPDEPEQPPKPPFADEEEEEEMMLREELLKSLANKRAVKSEVRIVMPEHFSMWPVESTVSHDMWLQLDIFITVSGRKMLSLMIC